MNNSQVDISMFKLVAGLLHLSLFFFISRSVCPNQLSSLPQASYPSYLYSVFSTSVSTTFLMVTKTTFSHFPCPSTLPTIDINTHNSLVSGIGTNHSHCRDTSSNLYWNLWLDYLSLYISSYCHAPFIPYIIAWVTVLNQFWTVKSHVVLPVAY